MIRPPRKFRRRWPAVPGLVAALIACVLIAAAHGAAADPADDPAEWRLPTVVNAPGAWSDDEHHKGPVAAIGLAQRTIPVGLTGQRQELSYFATSALDGSSSWLKLPGFSFERSGLLGGVAVSPDGRWLGWVRTGKRHTIKGWAIKDTTTGSIRNISVEGHDRVRPTASEVAFSGDSRHLLTTFETPGQPRRGHRSRQFVAWRVTDGEPTTLEGPGRRTLPNLGYADKGVVWSRNREVFRVDPGTGRRNVITLPRTVLMASWAPGDAAFAYIGSAPRQNGRRSTWERLYVGPTAARAHQVVDLPDTSPIGEALAWRDATHVVVGNFRGEMYVVDVVDGSYETLDVIGSGEQVNTPLLATALWAKTLRSPEAPTETSDPRSPWRWAGLGLFLALVGTGVLLLRRADRAALGRSPHGQLDGQGAQP